jgi:TatD DNase family protein
MVLSDSHCHLDKYQPEAVTQLLEKARAEGVDIMVSMGETLESSAEAIRLARSHQEVLAGVGIHPWNAVAPTEDIRKSFYELTKSEKVVAIGEIGLDYARNPQTKEVQKDLLRYELSLAREIGLPVDIHCRDAHQDMMDILSKETASGLQGIAHGFTGDSAELKDWLDLGFYISIGVRGFTINEIPHLMAAISEIPLDHLITETDCSGSVQPTGPADVSLVVQKLASLRGDSAENIASTATANLKQLIKL